MTETPTTPAPLSLIGSTDVATRLGVSPRTVHRLAQSGALPPAVRGPGGMHGSLLFDPDAVEAYQRAQAELDAQTDTN